MPDEDGLRAGSDESASRLTAVIGSDELHHLGWGDAFFPVGAGCVLMLFVAILVNNLARHRRYPLHW
ncbi:HPP family protein [Salinicola peritrichatus]|uniref:HPP family protein n=1 Tax=Salinicola peritrichatus TaxID=1267424 RepID=UPI001EF8EECE|nr:HPP family protein [Salinicola peritrichatus]